VTATGEGAEEPSLQDGLRLEVFSYRLSHLAGAHHAVHLEIRCKYKQSFPNFQILQKEKTPALPWAGAGVVLV